MNKWKYNKYRVALRIVFSEMKDEKSLKPLMLMWKKRWYGDKYPYRLITTLPEYVNFCRINNRVVCLHNEELA